MRIAIFSDAFLPIASGVVTATINLVKGLADNGNKVFIIAPYYKNIKEFNYPNIQVIRVGSVPAVLYKDFKITNIVSLKLLNRLKKEKIDIIHFATPLTLGIEAIIMSKLLKIPLVGTFHTFSADKEFLKHFHLDYDIFQEVSWVFNRLIYNRCDLITCPSKTAMRELIIHGFKKNIKVISNGIDSKIFNNYKWKSVRKKFGSSGKLLLFVGRVAHEKNIIYLLECFSKVANIVPNTKLLVIGDGPIMKLVKNKISALGLNKKVILLGQMEHSKLVKSSIFKACDLFVTASVTENQPMTILEAQINGLVCAGIEARGMKDLIINGYNGYLSKRDKPEDFVKNIAKIITNDKLRNKMKKNTMKMIQQHNLQNIIPLWEDTYKSLIRRH